MSDAFLPILLSHNTWATRILLDQSSTLTPEQFHRRFEIGLCTIHDSLRHIIGASIRWADRIAVRTLRESIEKGGQFSVAQLTDFLERADAELREVADQLNASGGWNEQIQYVDDNGRVYRFSKASAMMHVVTHGVHHRAQVLNMLRQLGRPGLPIALDPIEWESMRTDVSPFFA